MHRAQLSENGTFLIDNFTSNDVPREISILPTDGKKGVTLLTATDPMKEQYNLPEISIGTIKAADGKTNLYYRLIKPVGFDPNKKYPAIIYVYGGPHAQMIHNTRFYDARGWDLYMAQQGYVMLTVDNRGVITGASVRKLHLPPIRRRRSQRPSGRSQVPAITSVCGCRKDRRTRLEFRWLYDH